MTSALTLIYHVPTTISLKKSQSCIRIKRIVVTSNLNSNLSVLMDFLKVLFCQSVTVFCEIFDKKYLLGTD